MIHYNILIEVLSAHLVQGYSFEVVICRSFSRLFEQVQLPVGGGGAFTAWLAFASGGTALLCPFALDRHSNVGKLQSGGTAKNPGWESAASARTDSLLYLPPCSSFHLPHDALYHSHRTNEAREPDAMIAPRRNMPS